MLKSFAKYIIGISFCSSGEDQYLPYKVILNETIVSSGNYQINLIWISRNVLVLDEIILVYEFNTQCTGMIRGE